MTDQEMMIDVVPEIVAFAMGQEKAMCGRAVMAMLACLHSGKMATLDEFSRAAMLGHAVDLFMQATSK